MKFNHFAILFVAILLAFSCKTTKVAQEDFMNKRLDDALLWKVEGKDLKQPSYVFGTIHIIPDKDYFLPEGTLTAIDQSKKVFFEIDMNEMTDVGSQMGLLKKAFMKDGQTLKDLLTTEDYSLVQAHFKEMGLPLMLFEKMKPMFLTVFASSDFDPNGMQSGALKSYEMEIFEIANRSSKEVGGLETIDFQIGLFDSIPYPEQAKMLMETIKNGDTGGMDFDKTVNLYKSQNITAMSDLSGSGEEQLGNYEEILLNKRNRAWIPLMNEAMKKETNFFAVGAGHLGGKSGVIKLLMKEGYTVTPIKAKP